MCTVSWLHGTEGYQLLCNRDERTTRRQAKQPRLQVRDGVRYLAPLDPDRGGTWLAVNEFGLCVALLNGAVLHAIPDQAGLNADAISRGLLIPELITSTTGADVMQRLGRMPLQRFPAFTMVVLEPLGPALAAEWSGSEFTVLPDADRHMPLISSSVQQEAAREFRQRDLQRRIGQVGQLSSAVLWEFHESHGPGPGALSTCMHRADAQTVSFSWVQVGQGSVDFFYSPGAPCQMKPGVQQSLERHPLG